VGLACAVALGADRVLLTDIDEEALAVRRHMQPPTARGPTRASGLTFLTYFEAAA
jgi:hypothetical protein